MIKIIRMYWCFTILFLIMLGGCKKITQPSRVRQQIQEATISEIPLPLLNSELIDVSLQQDASIIEVQSLFSPEYVENFFITELDHRGWDLANKWVIDTYTTFLLFERLQQRTIVELSSGEQGSRIRFFRKLLV